MRAAEVEVRGRCRRSGDRESPDGGASQRSVLARDQTGMGVGVVHLAGDLPDEGHRMGSGIGFTDLPEPSCTRSPQPTIARSRSGHCSPGTEASISLPSTSPVDARSGSPNSTNPSPKCSRTTGPKPRTSATSPPSAGATSNRSTCCAADSHARTSPRSARVQASHPAPAPASGPTWQPPSRRCNQRSW